MEKNEKPIEKNVNKKVNDELKVDAKGKKKRKPLSKKAKIALWCSIASFTVIAIVLPVLLVAVFNIDKKTTPAKAFYYEKIMVNIDGVETEGYKITSIKEVYRDNSKNIKIPDTHNGKPVLVIGQDFFAELDSEKVTTLFIPKSVYQIDALGSSGNGLASIGLKDIFVDEDNKVFCDVDGVLFSKDKTILLSYPMAKEGTEYAVPEECSKLGVWAFFGVRNLVTINAESVTVLLSDEQIGLQFNGAIKLENLNMKNINRVPFGAFWGCKSLKKVDFHLVNKLEFYSFLNCIALEEVNLPSATSFDHACFIDCLNLKKITVKNSKTLFEITSQNRVELSLVGSMTNSILNALQKWLKYDFGIMEVRNVSSGYTPFSGCKVLDEIVITATVFDDDVKKLLQDSVFSADTIDVYFETQALVDAFNSWYAGTKFVAHVSE